MKVALSLAILAPLLMGAKGGCQLFGGGDPQVTAVDTFCLSAQKRKWSVNDTPETIRDAEAWNTAIDKKCGTKKA